MTVPTQQTGHPIGTRVRVKCQGSRLDGEETTVIGRLMLWKSIYGDFMGQQVDLIDKIDPTPAAFRPDELIPIYDGHEPCSWEDSIWKPTKEGVTC